MDAAGLPPCRLALEPAERDRYGFQCRLISERSVRQGLERAFIHIIKDIRVIKMHFYI